jgi:hypothetical protein
LVVAAVAVLGLRDSSASPPSLPGSARHAAAADGRRPWRPAARLGHARRAHARPTVASWPPGGSPQPLDLDAARADGPLRPAVDGDGTARLVFPHRAPGAADHAWTQAAITRAQVVTERLFAPRQGVVDVELAIGSAMALWTASGRGPDAAHAGRLR